MSAKLTDLAKRMSNLSEWRGSESFDVATEAIGQASLLEVKLARACWLLESLNDSGQSYDPTITDFIGECGELLK